MNFWSINIFVKEHPDVKDLQRRDRNLLIQKLFYKDMKASNLW